MEGAHGGRASVYCGCRCAGLCNVPRATRAVHGNGAFGTVLQGPCKGEQAGGTAPAAGAADGHKAQALDDAGNELAIERLRDQNVDAQIAITIGSQQKGVVPEGIQVCTGGLVGGRRRWGSVSFEAQCRAEQADAGCGHWWQQCEGEALCACELRNVFVQHLTLLMIVGCKC